MSVASRTLRVQPDGLLTTAILYTLDDYLATEAGEYLVTHAGEWLQLNSPHVGNRAIRQRVWQAPVDVRRQYADLDGQVPTAASFAFDDYWIDEAREFVVTEAAELLRINTLHTANRTIRQRVAVATPA
jgi:hypothetical protein